MSGGRKVAWSDAEMLRVLDLRDGAGLTARQIAQRLSRELGRAVTRNAIYGLTKRIDDELRAQSDRAARPENRDGGMAPGWYLAGLAARWLEHFSRRQ